MFFFKQNRIQCTLGSVILATPPCLRISAGTLSKAITAQACNDHNIIQPANYHYKQARKNLEKIEDCLSRAHTTWTPPVDKQLSLLILVSLSTTCVNQLYFLPATSNNTVLFFKDLSRMFQSSILDFANNCHQLHLRYGENEIGYYGLKLRVIPLLLQLSWLVRLQ